MVEVGQVISGKYKLLRLLGDGGMGAVYEAEHTTLGTHVAIKVLHGDLARRAGLIERFLQEARVSAQIKSPHVVMVHDVDRTPEGVAYLVMELLQGEPLGSVIKRHGRMPVTTACEYAVQILEALEAAHSLGVIHRDLKPDNVFVTFQGGKPVLKLIDFGIAKLKREGTKNLTVAGMLMGTPEYMAPEQAYAADKVDVRADLYAVGVMLYEMLSGQPPVSGPDPRILVAKIERGEITPLVHAAPGIRPELAGFVHRAMAPRPEVRFANATEMKVALCDVMAGKKTNVGTAPLKASVAPVVPPELMDTDRQAPPMGTGTVMGAPMAGAMSVAPHPGAPTPMIAPSAPYEASRPLPRRRSGSGLVVALALIATLLGAGAVVTYVMSTQEPAPAPPPTFATATTTTQPPVTPPTIASTTVTAAPPLKPTQPLTPTPPVSPQPPTTPQAKPDAGAAPSTPPQAQPDAGATGPIVTTPTDAGGAIITIPGVGSVPIPGPGERPPFWPPNQPWPPAAPQWPPPPQ